jgi:hypothetical protein
MDVSEAMNPELGAREQSAVSRPCLMRTAYCLLIGVAATALFLLPLLREEVFTLRDHFDYFQPLRWFTASELQAGRIPLWNPYNASGEPWLANPQTGVFYPPSWLFLAVPFATAYMLFLLFHLILLGCGAFLLFARSRSRGAALVGAVALMFSGPVLSLLDVSNNLATLAWIPLALWCAAQGAWRRGGFVLALAFLGGEPFFAAVAAVLYAVVAMAAPGSPVPRFLGSSGRLASKVRPLLLAGLVAFGVSAIQLLPFVELLRGSDRAARLDASAVLQDSMRLRDWVDVALPVERELSGLDSLRRQQFLPVVYAGVIVCALALAGIRRRTIGWLVLLVAAMAISTGPLWLAELPVTLFRYPARLVALGALALAALAATGWDRVRRRERLWLDLLLVLLVIGDLTPRVWRLLDTARFRTDVVPYAANIGATSKILRVGPADPRERTAWISGYLNLYQRRFDAFTAAPVTSERYVRMHRRLLEKPTREELAQKAIGWVITTYNLAPAFTRVARVDDVTVYRNRATLPMAALLMRNPLTLVPVSVTLDTSQARMIVDAPREGVILLHQQDAPGWRATVDGVDARSSVNGELFRAVQVTRGRHVIVWKYRPQSLIAGALITIATLLMLSISSFVKRAR